MFRAAADRFFAVADADAAASAAREKSLLDELGNLRQTQRFASVRTWRSGDKSLKRRKPRRLRQRLTQNESGDEAAAARAKAVARASEAQAQAAAATVESALRLDEVAAAEATKAAVQPLRPSWSVGSSIE